MNMDKRIIGEKAGIIWRTLHNNKMSWEELLKNTGLACQRGQNIHLSQ